jgi:LacI family transcriptional regulator
MVKIKDIAKACNTSSATVSKALSNSSELSQATIDRIQQKAKEMGYVPNAYARALKLKRSYSIGVIFHDPTHGGLRHEYFSTVIEALKTEAENAGYAITFLSRSDKMPSDSYLSLARYWNMDGVVIVSEDFTGPGLLELVRSSLPVVTIDYVYPECDAVLSDNEAGMEKLVDYIVSLGHTKIAFVHGEMTDVTKKRLEGYRAALLKHGIPYREEFVKEAFFHLPRTSGHATKELLALDDRPTCICYPDDVSMLGGLTALQEHGLTPGKDISVAGYDGVELSKLYRPRFTTYEQNAGELGSQAAKLLISEIENGSRKAPSIVTVEGKIQEGETVVPPSGKE